MLGLPVIIQLGQGAATQMDGHGLGQQRRGSVRMYFWEMAMSSFRQCGERQKWHRSTAAAQLDGWAWAYLGGFP